MVGAGGRSCSIGGSLGTPDRARQELQPGATSRRRPALEVRFFMPVLNVPFRLIFAYNPQRDGRAGQQLAAAEGVPVPVRGRVDVLSKINGLPSIRSVQRQVLISLDERIQRNERFSLIAASLALSAMALSAASVFAQAARRPAAAGPRSRAAQPRRPRRRRPRPRRTPTPRRSRPRRSRRARRSPTSTCRRIFQQSADGKAALAPSVNALIAEEADRGRRQGQAAPGQPAEAADRAAAS